MARTALRVRFVLRNGGAFETRSRQTIGKAFASAVVNDLTFRAAEGQFEEIRSRIQASFLKDARRELTHLAALYRRHIIGSARSKGRPTGMLGYALPPSDTGVGDDDDAIAIASTLPDWAPLSKKYLREKGRNNWSAARFSARGNLAKNMRAETLIQAFGPIRVSVRRNLRSAPPKAATFNFDGKAKINVATVRVFALTFITPSMLPGLRSANPFEVKIGDGGNYGLRNLMRTNVGDEFANSVSGFSARETGSRYRPTIEPFLTFYLTRSIPNALALRIEQGRLRS